MLVDQFDKVGEKLTTEIITKDTINKYLNNSYKIFSSRNLTRTANTLKEIIVELNNKPDYANINRKFKILQLSMINEYQGTDSHKTQCATFLKKIWTKAVTQNHLEVKKIVNNKTIITNRQNRTKARYTLGKLVYIIQRGAKTNEDNLIGLSVLYMYVIDGIYGKDLRDYCMWYKLAEKEKIEATQLLRMKIHELVEYFKLKGVNFLIDGWDDDIRNAIAHSSFYYDKSKDKMIYEERRRSVIRELSLIELQKMYQKLDHVDELLMHMEQVMNVNDCIDYFKRNSIP